MPQQDTPIHFVKGDKVGDETDYRDALPVNMYTVPKPIFEEQGYMIQNYGIVLFGTATGGECRGAFYNDRFQNQFRVQGNDFVEVDENGVVNILGAVTGYQPQINKIPPVTLDYSFNTQAVLADGRFFLYASGSGYNEVTDPELGNPIDFVWIDGFYFFTDGENLYHTLLTDETMIEPLDFGVAQLIPDGARGVERTEDNKVIVFGRYSTEFFYNDGSADFAFARVQGRALKIGIAATHLKTELQSKFFVVGGARNESLGVHIIGAGGAQRVSTREIEKILDQYSEDDLVYSHMETYTIEGNSFIKIHLPGETLLYNHTAAEAFGLLAAWTLLKSDVFGDNPDRSSYAILDGRVGDWVVGDLTDGKIGLMDNKVSTQYDEIIEWLLFSPFMYLEFHSLDELELQIIPGFTASNDASVFLSITYEGVFYGQEKIVDYGMIQEYGKRFIARRLGYVRDYFSIKLKGASRSRMAFSRGKITHGK